MYPYVHVVRHHRWPHLRVGALADACQQHRYLGPDASTGMDAEIALQHLPAELTQILVLLSKCRMEINGSIIDALVI